MLSLWVESDIYFFCPSLQVFRALVDMEIHKMPETDPPDKDYWSTEAIKPLLEGISKADWVRLNRVAAYRCSIVPGEPDELLQEAVLRVLSGQRRCPKDIPISVFLKHTMRSIASSSAKSFSKKPDIVPPLNFEE